jgi:hypothetical protein
VVAGNTASYDLRVFSLWSITRPLDFGAHRFAVTGVSGAGGTLSISSSPCVSIPIIGSRLLNGVVVQTSPTTPGGTHTITLTVTEYVSNAACSGATIDTRTRTATLSVLALQTITFAPLADMTYGDPAFDLTATASSGLPVSYGIAGPCSLSGISLTTTGAGTCSVTASQAGGVDWAPADPVTQSFDIAPAALTITVNSVSRTYDEPNPAFTVSYSGFIGADTEADLSGTLAFTTSATATSPAGGYPVSASGLTNGDYAITYVDGTLTVTAGALHHIVVGPDPATIVAGATQAYTAEAFDAGDNSLGDVTASTVFTIDGSGSSCTGAACGSTVAGAYTVTGTYGAVSDTAALGVNAGALHHIVVGPDPATIIAGGSQAYTAEGFDQYNNSLGDVTASTVFTIDGSGSSCTSAACGSTIAGAYTVTGTDGAVSDTAALGVNAGALHHIVVGPDPATIAAGATQAYTAEAFDAGNNSLGDVTGSTVFTIDGGGSSCTGATCGSMAVGAHTVTGTDGAVSDTAVLNVTVGVPHYIVMTPSPSEVVLGATQAYTVAAFDEYWNSLGDVTASTVFTIDGTGSSCTGAACGSSIVGDYTVTATIVVEGIGNVTATALLRVAAAPPTQPIITPAPTGTEGSLPGEDSSLLLGLLIAVALGQLGVLFALSQRRLIRR